MIACSSCNDTTVTREGLLRSCVRSVPKAPAFRYLSPGIMAFRRKYFPFPYCIARAFLFLCADRKGLFHL